MLMTGRLGSSASAPHDRALVDFDNLFADSGNPTIDTVPLLDAPSSRPTLDLNRRPAVRYRFVASKHLTGP